jgi:hypothetical protein
MNIKQVHAKLKELAQGKYISLTYKILILRWHNGHNKYIC